MIDHFLISDFLSHNAVKTVIVVAIVEKLSRTGEIRWRRQENDRYKENTQQ